MKVMEVEPSMELHKSNERTGWGLAYSRRSGLWYIVNTDVVYGVGFNYGLMDDIFQRLVKGARFNS